MIQNYLKVALRNLWKYRFFSLINVLGLALGMACCLLILLHVRNEWSYDRYHQKAAALYRVEMRMNLVDQVNPYPFIAYRWAELLRTDIPQVVNVARLQHPNEAWMIKEDERFKEEELFYADRHVPELFDLTIRRSNSDTLLKAPYRMLVSASAATKYFGDEDPLGKSLGIEFGANVVDIEVEGVMEDFPTFSHIHPSFLVSFETFRSVLGDEHPFFKQLGAGATYTYAHIPDASAVEAVDEQLQQLVQRHASEQEREYLQGLYLKPMTDIHLHSNLIGEIETNGSAQHVYVFLSIALLTLLIACVNFMNLATARSAKRAQEVGMRKVIGALRPQLIVQFLSESLLVALLAVALAIGLSEVLLPYLNREAGFMLRLPYEQPLFWLLLLGMVTLVGLLSGSYPAFFLSAFQPIAVLKGKVGSGAGGGGFRRVLVVTQFAISTALIIGSLVILQQLSYIQTMDLGFQRDWQVVVPVQMNNQNQARERAMELLKQRYLQHPGIQHVTATSNIPGGPRPLIPLRLKRAPPDETHQFTTVFTDFEHVEAMDIELIEGRNFDPGLRTDSLQSFLVNETGWNKLGRPPLGETPILWNTNPGQGGGNTVVEGQIVGVFRDMHFEPIYREIYPMVLKVGLARASNLVVKVSPEQFDESLAYMESEWKQVINTRPFAYEFMDQRLAEMYENEARLSKLVSLYTGLALVIAALGLFGLSAFTAEQRRREIGIRKVLGASSGNILMLLSREFALLVLISFLLAAPLAYYGLSLWLDNFAYQAAFSPWLYVLGGLFTLSVALLTVSLQSWRAARANPIDAIRTE